MARVAGVLMNRNRRLTVVVSASALCGAVLLAQSAKLVTSWAAPTTGPLSFAGKKVAALAMVSDMNVRMSAEEALAREITARGPQGVAAYRVIPKEELVDKDRAKAWFTRTGVAGVVTMRVVNVDT